VDTFTIGAAPGTTAATIDHAIAQLWNPSSAVHLFVTQVHAVKITATGLNILVLRRSSARGTAGSTITPTAINDHGHRLAPPSGALLDLAAFSVQPTLDALNLFNWALPAAIGSGVIWTFAEPIRVQAGDGLVLTQGNAVASDVGGRVTFSWME
jgi:hypothetical protein